LVYESIKSEVYKKVGNTYDWVEVEDKTDTPEIIVINDVAYTVGQLEAINNEYEAINHNWFYDDQDQRKDLIKIAQNKWEKELENQKRASFDIYQI
jgi:tRNA U54 and U55 pseudouridine synthase Pus10